MWFEEIFEEYYSQLVANRLASIWDRLETARVKAEVDEGNGCKDQDLLCSEITAPWEFGHSKEFLVWQQSRGDWHPNHGNKLRNDGW